MGSFLDDHKRRVRIQVPGAIKTSWEFDIMITQESYDNGEIKIFQDDILAVTINADGEIQTHR